MAHGAFRVLDSDIHIIEPPDLWPRSIDPAFRDRAPIVFSTDFPHETRSSVASFFRLPISDESKRKILWDNGAAYYGLRS